MRFIFLFTLFSLFACKRNHTSVLVKTINSETGQPISNINIKVYRKGKETMFVKKGDLLVAGGITNAFGECLLNFKYDRANNYFVEVFNGDKYWGNDLLTNLEKGKNEATFDLYPYCYLKLNLKSLNPFDKGLKIEIENETDGFITSKRFYNYSNPMDTFFSYKLRLKGGSKIIKCTVDSSWTIKQNLSIPIQLLGNDTANAIINF